MKLTDQSISVITEIKENDIIWVVRGGVDYKIEGNSLISQFASVSESEIYASGVTPSNIVDLGIGIASTIDFALLNFKIKRGSRRCSGQIIIACNGVDASYNIINQVMLPNTGDETGGAGLSVKIESGQLFVTVKTDGLDSDLTDFKAKIKII